MKTELITITEYCTNCAIDPAFIGLLEESGLIALTVIGNDKFIHEEQLMEMERYIHFHYDMDINVEGIDAIMHLLQKVRSMQQEILELRNQVYLHKAHHD